MNCIIVDDDPLSCRILEECIRKTEGLEHCGSYGNPVEALNASNNFVDVDLLFLDIEMPEMTGFELLRSLDRIPLVIMISAKEKYAVDAFDFDITDYLLKPITYARFFKGVKKAMGRRTTKSAQLKTVMDDGIFLKRNNAFVRIKYSEVLTIEALENYVTMRTIDGKFVLHQSLKSIEEKLPQSSFRRVHRSFIVNVNHIKSVQDNDIVMYFTPEGTVIPLGKSYRDKLLGDLKTIG